MSEPVEIRPGVWTIPGAAPEPGTELTPERIAANLKSLREPYNALEMRSLALWVLSDGTHGEPARTLAKHVMELLGEAE